jgi:hypothetical protein
MDASYGGAADDGGLAGAAGAPAIGSAVILIDNVVVKDGVAVKHQWQFASDAQISDTSTPTNPGDEWSRYFYGDPASPSGAGAHDVFSCDGNPTAGSLKNLIPFSDVNQYYINGVPFAAEDYTGFTISAKVKLVSGGKNDEACPARASLYVGGGQIVGNIITGPGVALAQGSWVDVTMTVAEATGTDAVDRVGFNLNTYACQ